MRRRSRLRGRRDRERLFCRSGWGRRRAQKTWCSKALVKKMKGKEQKGESCAERKTCMQGIQACRKEASPGKGLLISPSPMCEVVAVFLFSERGSETVWAVGAGRGWLGVQLGFRPEWPGVQPSPVPQLGRRGPRQSCYQPQAFGKDYHGWSLGVRRIVC